VLLGVVVSEDLFRFGAMGSIARAEETAKTLVKLQPLDRKNLAIQRDLLGIGLEGNDLSKLGFGNPDLVSPQVVLNVADELISALRVDAGHKTVSLVHSEVKLSQ